MTHSRTALSIKNSTIALIFYFANLVIQFIGRKIFLNHLGTEVLGLNTTATNLMQFLNLAELGIGSAIGCTLYKPLLQHDQPTINEIISLQGWMYRRIAWIVILGSIVMMCFFPIIFAKIQLPMWYTFASFGVLLISAILSYFTNYKQILLSADQKEYKIQYSYKASMLIKVLCQTFAIKYFNYGYIWWLILEIIFAFIGSIALNYTIHKTYPNLKISLSNGKQLRSKYPEIITKIKQLFFHKIGGFALTQTSPIIIYGYASLSLVALYGNYTLIIMGVSSLMYAVFNSTGAGIGNLVAEGSQARIMSVFKEFFSIRFLLSCTVCFGVYMLTPAFITLWIGSEYILDNMTLGLMVLILYINMTRLTIDAYINAYGLFGDIWASIIEASLNIGLSVLFGYFWNLHGILAGVLTSLIIVIFTWKPYYLFKKGLKEDVRQYITLYFKHIIAFLLTIGTLYTIVKFIPFPNPSLNIISFILYGITIIGLFFVILMSYLYIIVKSMRDFIHRIVAFIK